MFIFSQNNQCESCSSHQHECMDIKNIKIRVRMKKLQFLQNQRVFIKFHSTEVLSRRGAFNAHDSTGWRLRANKEEP